MNYDGYECKYPTNTKKTAVTQEFLCFLHSLGRFSFRKIKVLPGRVERRIRILEFLIRNVVKRLQASREYCRR